LGNPLCPTGQCAVPMAQYPAVTGCTTDADCGGGGHGSGVAGAGAAGSCIQGATTKVCAGSCNVDADCSTAGTYPPPEGICKVATHTCQVVLDPRCNAIKNDSMQNTTRKFDARVFNLVGYTKNLTTLGSFKRIQVNRANGLIPPCADGS